MTALLLTTQVGCWEQWSDSWFPQMKRQKAVQAFESVDFEGRVEAFSPPEGSVPVEGGEAPVQERKKAEEAPQGPNESDRAELTR